ncbi:MAG: hypothetical protein QXF06_00230 [Archaeoglobaceae archaeon]
MVKFRGKDEYFKYWRVKKELVEPFNLFSRLSCISNQFFSFLSSSVLLVLDKKKQLNLSFKCVPFIFEQNISQEMGIYFNGHFVENLTLNADWGVYNVTIPREFTRNGANYLEFRYKYAESPKDFGINEKMVEN